MGRGWQRSLAGKNQCLHFMGCACDRSVAMATAGDAARGGGKGVNRYYALLLLDLFSPYCRVWLRAMEYF